MALYIPHSIFHLARLLYVRPETFGPYCVFSKPRNLELQHKILCQAYFLCYLLHFCTFFVSLEICVFVGLRNVLNKSRWGFFFKYVASTVEFVTHLCEETDVHCETGRDVRGHSAAGTTGENGEQLG